MKPSDPGLFFIGKFLIMDLIFLLVVLRIFFQIFNFFIIQLLVNYVSRNLSIASRLSNFLVYTCY